MRSISANLRKRFSREHVHSIDMKARIKLDRSRSKVTGFEWEDDQDLSQLIQGYGMTECVPVMLAPDHVPLTKQGSVGVVVASNEARVVNAQTDLDCSLGEPGEIWLRGPEAMSGYLDEPEATAATLDADGWIHTGDLGYADEDGYFFIVDRLKKLIKYKGYQVAPAELEALLLTHPDVADVGVVRYPDEDAGEIPKAFVVRRAPLDADELMAWVAERVAPYKKIRMVEFIDAIPKSASGKILRRELIDRNRAAAPALVSNGIGNDRA